MFKHFKVHFSLIFLSVLRIFFFASLILSSIETVCVFLMCVNTQSIEPH